MNEELIIEKGTIEEFLNLITKCYDDFIFNTQTQASYEQLLSEGRIEPDGPAYSRLQKLKLDKLMRSKYGSYYAKRSKRLHGRIQRENERQTK